VTTEFDAVASSSAVAKEESADRQIRRSRLVPSERLGTGRRDARIHAKAAADQAPYVEKL
jgi:hypothetical protein